MEKEPATRWHKPHSWVAPGHWVPPSAPRHIPWQRTIPCFFSAQNLWLLPCWLPGTRAARPRSQNQAGFRQQSRDAGKEGRGIPWGVPGPKQRSAVPWGCKYMRNWNIGKITEVSPWLLIWTKLLKTSARESLSGLNYSHKNCCAHLGSSCFQHVLHCAEWSKCTEPPCRCARQIWNLSYCPNITCTSTYRGLRVLQHKTK